MTLAMFMLVVFTLTAMNFVQIAMGAAFEYPGNLRRLRDSGQRGLRRPDPRHGRGRRGRRGHTGEVTAVAGVSNLPLEVSKEEPVGSREASLWRAWIGLLEERVGYGFQATARGYGSDREVWEALRAGDAAIISADLAPARNASTFGPAVKPPVKLSGFYADDESLPDDLYLRAEDPDTGANEGCV